MKGIQWEGYVPKLRAYYIKAQDKYFGFAGIEQPSESTRQEIAEDGIFYNWGVDLSEKTAIEVEKVIQAEGRPDDMGEASSN
jgi:hypothetical protein